MNFINLTLCKINFIVITSLGERSFRTTPTMVHIGCGAHRLHYNGQFFKFEKNTVDEYSE